jgi:hypothetical protein
VSCGGGGAAQVANAESVFCEQVRATPLIGRVGRLSASPERCDGEHSIDRGLIEDGPDVIPDPGKPRAGSDL